MKIPEIQGFDEFGPRKDLYFNFWDISGQEQRIEVEKRNGWIFSEILDGFHQIGCQQRECRKLTFRRVRRGMSCM